MAEVEILLGTRNGARHLGTQLASFAGQCLRDWTLLASDDGSTDGTKEILARFGQARPGANLRVITGPQSGVAANYLHLLRGADKSAPFVALSDQDDVWFPEKLRRGVSVLRAVPRSTPALYAAQSRLIDATGKPLGKTRFHPPQASFENALVQNVMAGNTMILNRAAADLVADAMPQSLPPFHDWWVYAVLAGAGARLIVDPQPVLAYRQHDQGVLGAHAGAAARLSRMAMVLDGTWKEWLRTHHLALATVSMHLKPAHRAQLDALIAAQGQVARLGTFRRGGIHRQAKLGTAFLGLAALAGLA